MKTLILALAAGLGVAASGGASAAVLLSDNFNSDALRLNSPGDGVFASTSSPGSVDIVGPGFFNLCGPGNGRCVDLDGSTGYGHNPAGQLTSLLSFGPGTYTLSFDLAGNNRGAAAQTTVVSLGTFSASLTPAANAGPTLHTYTFTTTTGGALVFTERGPSDDRGNLLDNVILSSSAVAEPAAWAMMLAGFAVLGGAVRRRASAYA